MPNLLDPIDDETAGDILAALADDLWDWCEEPRQYTLDPNCAHCPYCYENHWNGCHHLVIVSISRKEGDDTEFPLFNDLWAPTLTMDHGLDDDDIEAALGDLSGLLEAYEYGLEEQPSGTELIELVTEMLTTPVVALYVGSGGCPVDAAYFAAKPKDVEAEFRAIVDELADRFDRLAAHRRPSSGGDTHA